MAQELSKVETVQEGAPEWMCTFADMMSLLLTFFILLLSFSTLDIIKYERALGSIKDAFGVKEIVTGKEIAKKEQPVVTPGEGRLSEQYQREDTLNELEEAIHSDGLEEEMHVGEDKRGVVVSITSHVMFNVGSSQLKEKAFSILGKIALLMKKYSYQLSVEGHTDNLPVYSEIIPSNWELSLYRATEVVRFLIDEKVDKNRLCAVGYGDTRALVPNTTEQNRAKNRRVEFVFKRVETQAK